MHTLTHVAPIIIHKGSFFDDYPIVKMLTLVAV